MVGALVLCPPPRALRWLLAAESLEATGRGRMPDQLKIALLILLAGVAVVGLVLLLLTWAIGRYVRRTVRRSDRHLPPTGIGPSDWDSKPWQPDDERDAGQAPRDEGSAEP